MGALADASGRRKPWIGAFTMLCITATALLWFIQPSTNFILPALILVCVGTIGSEYANIFYNAMLPDLTERSRMGRWSGWGWGMGYAGGLMCLLLALYGFVDRNAFFSLPRTNAEHVRATMLLSAIWYMGFSLPLFFRTPDTPHTGRSPRQAVKNAIRQLYQSLVRIRQYKSIAIFLLARMLYNDGLTTMFAFGGIYAAGTFGMQPDEVILFGIGLNVTAGLGAAFFAWIDDKTGPKTVIMGALLGLTGCGLAMLTVKTKSMFWIFGLLLGIFVGPAQASSRTWLAHAAPPELRAQMFGLFALSGKLTSFAGPLFVGWLTLASGSQRIGLTAVIAFFATGLALMTFVPRVKNTNNTVPGRDDNA